MTRLFIVLLALFSITLPTRANDDIGAVSRSVVRVVTVAMVDGEVVGFGHGSGVAISPTRIITNAHVVESAVRYPDNVALGVVPAEGRKSYAAKLIAVDTERDLALIEITEGRVPASAIFTGPLEPGEDVVALGYPGNVDLAIARSAADYITPRTPVRSEGDLSNSQAVNGIATLVHTAKIARGNSGGPLVDGCGRVVGINSFITRADDGDSPFAFAVANREVARFLTDAGQNYRSVGTPCVSLAEADARDRAALDRDTRAAAAAASVEAEARTLDRERRSARASEAAQTSRENRIAIAGVLFVLGALGAGAGLLFNSQNNPRNARIAGGVGAALMLGAAIIFLTRPGTNVDPGPDAAPKAATDAAPPLASGDFICTIRPDRSRITVSETADVPVNVSGTGCVNGRTQYALGSDGRWQRILVPNQEATVTVASLSADGKEYRVDQYLLDADAMDKARILRAGVDVKACTTDAGAQTRLATQQDAIRNVLPANPNERLVYGCQAAVATN